MTWTLKGDAEFIKGKIAFHEKKMAEWKAELDAATEVLKTWQAQKACGPMTVEFQSWIDRQIARNDLELYQGRIKLHEEKIAAYKKELAKC